MEVVEQPAYEKETMNNLTKFSENIWTISTPITLFGLLDIENRALIFNIPEIKTLVVVNGVRLTEDTIQQLKQLELSTQSTIRYVISPADTHHLYLSNYEGPFPEAKIYIFAGRTVEQYPNNNWNLIDIDNPFPEFKEHNIHFHVFKGIRRPPPYDDRPKWELLVYIEPSKTLFACDILGFRAKSTWFSRNVLGNVDGAISFHPTKGLSIRNTAEAKDSALHVTQWDVWNFFASHGDLLHGGQETNDLLKKAFDFLLK